MVHIQIRNDAHSTVSAGARILVIHFGMGKRDKSVFSSAFSTQLKRAQTLTIESFPVPDPAADHTEEHDSR